MSRCKWLRIIIQIQSLALIFFLAYYSSVRGSQLSQRPRYEVNELKLVKQGFLPSLCNSTDQNDRFKQVLTFRAEEKAQAAATVINHFNIMPMILSLIGGVLNSALQLIKIIGCLKVHNQAKITTYQLLIIFLYASVILPLAGFNYESCVQVREWKDFFIDRIDDLFFYSTALQYLVFVVLLQIAVVYFWTYKIKEIVLPNLYLLYCSSFIILVVSGIIFFVIGAWATEESRIMTWTTVGLFLAQALNLSILTQKTESQPIL